MAAEQDDPAVQRRRLRVDLRKTRLEKGLTQRDVARAMDWSPSKLIRIENGEVRITRNDLRALVEYYQIGDRRQVDRLLEMARVSREESWSDFRDVHSPAFLTYLGFESSASVIRNYEVLLVPGLLQTEEYALDIQTSYRSHSSDVAERRWLARQRRQELHDRDQPPKMFFILDEGVLRRLVGGRGVMLHQLEELKRRNAEAHITIQILPFANGAHPGMGGPFVLLAFQNPSDDDLLYLESGTDETTTRDNADETGRYLQMFYELEDRALAPDATEGFLDRVMEELQGSTAGPQDETK